MKAYELKISLKDAKPPIWRKVIVPSDINFMQLHNIIQVAMGWQNYHMYEFNFKELDEVITNDSEACDEYEYFNSKANEKQLLAIGFYEHMPKTLYAKEVKIDKYLEKTKKFVYIYDFGDYWEHKIELVSVIDDYVGQLPIVTKFRKSCPPEDCGGIYGYYELLEALDNPSHPQHSEFTRWIENIGYSDEYDVDTVNEILKGITDIDDDDVF